MKKEIERKFLVVDNIWRTVSGPGLRFRQGYLTRQNDGLSVRIRILAQKAFLTIKGPTEGITRAEFEYEIPVVEAEALLDGFCGTRLIDKTRYTLHLGDDVWELDEFHGDNEGLVMAEIELGSEAQEFAEPGWLGEEVSGDSRYYNAALAVHPFKEGFV